MKLMCISLNISLDWLFRQWCCRASTSFVWSQAHFCEEKKKSSIT